MSPADDVWVATLDEFERCLATGDEFVVPTGLGAPPDRLAPRARALLADCDARRRDLVTERDRVTAELRSTQRLHRAPGTVTARDGRDPAILA